MSSSDACQLPSLLVFGPQTEFPSDEAISNLRQELVTKPHLQELKEAIITLPEFWQRLVDSHAALRSVPGQKYLGQLQHWIQNGGALTYETQEAPNHYVLPVTVLSQIVQYTCYLDQLGNNPHGKVLQSIQSGGIQGFCTGFLSAVAVAVSANHAELGSAAAVALRLAVAIGAYVDQDGQYSKQSTEYSTLAVRWREEQTENKSEVEKLLLYFEDAYISSINDETSVTITLKSCDAQKFVSTSQTKGLRTKAVHVHGRFHTPKHLSALDKLMKFVSSHSELQFPDVKAAHVPIRDTCKGTVVTEGNLTRAAIENTLVNVADWHATLKVAIENLPKSHRLAGLVGYPNIIPSSLSRDGGLRTIILGNPVGFGLKQGESLLSDSLGIIKSIDAVNESSDLSQYPPHSIAIVGMAGRFPGADSVDELWHLIMEGKSTVQRAPVERLGLPTTGDHANTKWWGNFLNDPDAFDHKFFKKSSREAVSWDPQQRVLLEVIYQALESAGYFGVSNKPEPHDYGCYIGAVMNNYYDNLSCHPGTAYATVGTSRCYLSGCMSHYFGWTGPSLTIDTACSSSLVAVNSACRAIWSGECSRAVAGGTNVISSPFDYLNLAAAGFLSPNGQCKPFDANADGYCRGEAVSVVVLKPLADAIQENDNILGVIVGSAANQNHNFSHITQPYSGSQVELYQKVMKLSGVEPESVSYVEAHGTGTGVGDPIEVRSIRDAFGGPQRDSILHFGSIKGNIGHAEATAGVAGLVKVLLMMQHKKITAQASHQSINPKIPAFDKSQMSISRSIIPWQAPYLLACVNSYGAAGSNSAVMVREKPSRGSKQSAPIHATKFPLFISAGSVNSVSQYSKKLLMWLKTRRSAGHSDSLAELAFNLADRANHKLPHIISTVVNSREELVAKLEKASSGSGVSRSQVPKPVVLVFAGQDSDHIGLSEHIYNSSKVFSGHLDSVNDLLVSSMSKTIYPYIFNAQSIDDLVVLHSALFAVQYASAKTWIDNGLNIDAIVGHSFGQLTALCISGVLSLADALKLVSGRASLMQKYWGAEAGSMLYLEADRTTVKGLINTVISRDDELYAEIACFNGPRSHVVVGSSRAIEALQQHITNAAHLQIRTKRLNVTNGFHSKYTEPLLSHLDAVAAELEWNKPQIHLELTLEHENKEEPHHQMVVQHTRNPVFFQHAVERLACRLGDSEWIEVGRGSSLIQFVKQSTTNSDRHEFHSPQLTTVKALDTLAEVTAKLWKSGQTVQYWPFHRAEKHGYEYLSLPPIQFEKTRHWLAFTGRRQFEETPTDVVEDILETHELMRFIEFRDSSKNEAVFKIDPQADRFQQMLGGHVMAGQTLAPASLYFEIAARAALFLQNDTEAKTYVPGTEDLSMKSPIGKSIAQKILLSLKKINDNTHPQWTFSITTQDTENQTAEPFEHTSGKVYLKERNNKQASRERQRIEKLIGHRRYMEVVDHEDAEKMRGHHIYRAFSTVVSYGESFRGIKEIACVGSEAAGKVRTTPETEDPTDQRLCDTPMTDSFMQFAGFLVNYFNNPSTEDVYVCMQIEQIEIAGGFDPDGGEWLVYATMSEGGEKGVDATADAYVFDAKTNTLVMTALGFRFSRMPQSLLARVLKSVNKSPLQLAQEDHKPSPPIETDCVPAQQPKTTSQPAATISSGKRNELLQVLSNVTDFPIAELKDDSTLEELGVDSLMATEVLNDIRSVLGLTIDLSTFLFLPNIRGLIDHVNDKLGLVDAGEDSLQEQSSGEDSGFSDSASLENGDGYRTPSTPIETEFLKPVEERPTITSAAAAFEETRHAYDRLAETTKALGFWGKAYPHQARLVLAYVVEAYADLGCDVRRLAPGDVVPQVNALAKHKQLVRQFYRVLEDGKLITSSTNGETFTRTDIPVDSSPAESIFHGMIDLYPQYASVNKLIRAVGSEMAPCLRGDKEGVQVLFGNRDTKRTLEEMYEFDPLMRTPTLVLGEFLEKALAHQATGRGKFRILEIGAGTGGTTRYIVKHLQSLGIEFEYTFTDLGASLVNAAARQFKGNPEMSFEVLNVEQPPKPEYEGAFHCIIATNCIHATRNLDVSLGNIRKMLRPDGALTLIEITQNMFWLDIVVGLLEGWWLFVDGREHALVDERHWERRMKGAGFEHVSWSDGTTPESKTVRVIAAFPTGIPTTPEKPIKAAVKTVVYKKIDDLEILADIYYPTEGDIPEKGLPVGNHMLFSRKDIRPAQTRLLMRQGFLPVSLDYRLCPEVPLQDGPMTDVCDALAWARNKLPALQHPRRGLKIDGERVVVIGWSSGGQLAMSLAWTAPARGLRPPESLLIFYAPTDYEDEWWRNPIQPNGAAYQGQEYNVLDGVQDRPLTNYDMVGAWEEPISDPQSWHDARCRIVLHINWKAQTLPVILQGLPSQKKADAESASASSEEKDWGSLPQPPLDLIRAASPRAHMRQGDYKVPTFFVHGTSDDLIPWQQSRGTYQTLADQGVATDLVLLNDAPHICDLSSDPRSDGWKAVLKGYDFIILHSR
uniref:Polyketide synthase n=1 Tax=Pestalotiopsis microspora TaxID=85828 RepID=A0A1P8NTH4_PESMI|nr:polyketide synthase [Pestalotiopsis microspora]